MEKDTPYIRADHPGELPVRIRSFRIRAGYTQEYVSMKLNVTRQAYSNYECGRRTPSLESLRVLSILYGIPMDSLIPG